jgi:PKD repeat protein
VKNGKGLLYTLALLTLIAAPINACRGPGTPTNISPVADFNYSPGVPNVGRSVSFTDGSTDCDGTIVSWDWDFGDGNTSGLQNPTHAFLSPGTYIVSLTVIDNDGYISNNSRMINVSALAPTIAIGKDEAIRILVSKIIKPADSYDRVSAFMLSEPLQPGDIVKPEASSEYPISSPTWFIFIDDEPEAFFAHATRYVFIDASTGTYEVENESWLPVINNISLWNTNNINRGNLIEIYSVIDSAMLIEASSSESPIGDYGDAPDGEDAYYGIPGHFPTLFDTTNSEFDRPGGHVLNTGEETIGYGVSEEVDANDSTDPDGVPNLVDADSDERIFIILDGNQAKVAFTVSVSTRAPDITRYANMLIDFDYSGDWNESSLGPEWTVVNLEVEVSPGTSETVVTPWFSWGNQDVPTSPPWMRLALTREEISESLFSTVGGWDGSGRFQYGEIEDFLVFLTDIPPMVEPTRPPYYWPPPPPGPPPGPPPMPPPGGGGGQPPGPPKGPCGYDIQYHVIVISGGDTSKHVAQGAPIVQQSTETMTDLAADQGYNSVANLGPGKGGSSENTLENIGQAFDNLANSVSCGDYVLIYICGHGYSSDDMPGGGIALKDSGGRTQEVLEPKDTDGDGNSLADLLKKIPSCPDEDCDLDGACCHVSVVIESCFAGSFNVDGVTGEGRAVMGSSTDTESWANSEGGVYTEGFDEDSRDPDADLSEPPDGVVDPMEANESAKADVEDNNGRRGRAQEPWEDNQWCECKCPCEPGIDVDKWVWDDLFDKWVDNIYGVPGQPVRFRLELENDGECRDIIDVMAIDFLPGCLDYEANTDLYLNGRRHSSGSPDQIRGSGGGLELTWDLSDLGPLSPGDSIAIEYDAVVVEPGINLNLFYSEAHCAYEYSNIVSDEDTAAVTVMPGVPPVEETLWAGFESHAESWLDPPFCESFFDVFFEVEDLTGGIYPIIEVVLRIDGDVWHDSENISEIYYSGLVDGPAYCGEIKEIELVAMNLIGQSLVVTDSITMPPVVK